MNRKYILLRRILGISTILLGLLIAILPMFGRAADYSVKIDDQRKDKFGAEYLSAWFYGANKEDPDQVLTVSEWVGVDGDEKEVLNNTGLQISDDDQIYLLTLNMDLPRDFKADSLRVTVPMPEVFYEVSGNDYEVYGHYRWFDEPWDKISCEYKDPGDHVLISFDANLEYIDDMYNYVIVKRANTEAEETPTPVNETTPTTAATPSTVQRPTVTPTPTRIPTSTPTPTTVPVRIPAIDDQRKDRSDTKGLSAFVYGGSVPNSILIIRDSDGVSIKRIVVLRKGMILKPWYIRLVDENKRDITDFKSITITLPIPETMNLKKGRVVMVGKRRNGKLQTFDTKIVTKNGFNCAEFTTDYFSDYEYGMLYTPDDGGEDENKLTVSDEREDKEGTEHIDGSVTEGSGKRTLHIADSDGVIILRRIVWKAGMILKPYRIWITDEAGNNVDEFGTLTVTLPLPADMDPEKGVLRVVGSTKDNDTDDFVPEIIKNDDGTYSVRFSTDYFSDNEYGLVYTPFDLEPDVTATPTATGTPTPTIQATATPTLSPTPYSNVTATPTQKAPTKPADVVIVTSTTTPTPKPPTPTEGNGGGDNGGDNGGGGNNGRGRTPIVTPKGGMFYENGLSMNYASTGNTGNGKTGGQTAVKGSGTGAKGSNAKDMPKTGMADVPRMLAVIILITLGCIQLVSTIPVKKD